MKSAWIIYFFLNIGTLLLILSDYTTIERLNLMSYLEIFFLVLSGICLYSYIFNKPLFTTLFWKFYFYLTLFDILFFFIDYRFDYSISNSLPSFLQSQTGEIPTNAEGMVIFYFTLFFIFYLPSFIANYRISQNKFLK